MELEACFTAILDGDLERFTELLEQHPDALKSFRDHSKSTLLHASVGKLWVTGVIAPMTPKGARSMTANP